MEYDEFVTRVAEREDRDVRSTSERASGERREHRDTEELASAERDAMGVVATPLDAVTDRESDDLLSHPTADYEEPFATVDPEEVRGPGRRARLGRVG